jgi:hypothetical protein
MAEYPTKTSKKQTKICTGLSENSNDVAGAASLTMLTIKTPGR